MFSRNYVNPLAVCSVALAATLSASGASLADGSKRTNVKIETVNARAVASAGAGSLPLTSGSLAPAQAIEIHPYVPIPNTNDTHTLSVQSQKPPR